MNTDNFLYYLLLWAGVITMIIALFLSFTLALPSHLRYEITGLIGIAGYTIATTAKKFRPKR